MNADLPNLTPEQREHVRMQWEKQQHQRFVTDIPLSGHGDILKDLIVSPGVWDPTIVSAKYHASYLYYNNARLFQNKRALDVGTGTGILGLVMAQAGAASVLLTDISSVAVKNAQENIEAHDLQNTCTAIESDLLEQVEGTFDCIMFALPYFGDIPPTNDSIAASMLAPFSVLETFLKEVRKVMSKDAVILLPFYTKAGEANNPARLGPEYGFKTTMTFITHSDSSIQKGELFMYELTQS